MVSDLIYVGRPTAVLNPLWHALRVTQLGLRCESGQEFKVAHYRRFRVQFADRAIDRGRLRARRYSGRAAGDRRLAGAASR